MNIKRIDRAKRLYEYDEVLGLENLAPKKILDFGCGDAELCNALTERGDFVVGTDIKFEQLLSAKYIFNKCRLVHYNAITLPFRDESFDLVIMNDVLEHIDYISIRSLLFEILRVLKPRGGIYISVANRFQIIEPHKQIPFLTWLPRPLRNPLCKILKNEEFLEYYPYTKGLLNHLLKEYDVSIKDHTKVYVDNKFRNLDYVNSKFLRAMIVASKIFYLEQPIRYLAQKVSVLVFFVSKEHF